MRLRYHPAVLRFHTSKKKEGCEQHCAELQLWTHWRKEFKKALAAKTENNDSSKSKKGDCNAWTKKGACSEGDGLFF